MKILILLILSIFCFEVSFAMSVSDSLNSSHGDQKVVITSGIQSAYLQQLEQNKAQQIAQTPLNTLQDVIQGRVPGVQVIGQGGLLAQDFHIFIRGISSFIGNNYPLIVIDGITPYAWNKDNSIPAFSSINHLYSINLSDVESIEVLKDGYAAAMYGPEATNGAIIIKTKRGVENRPKFSFSSETGVAQASRRIKMMDRGQYLSIIQQMYEFETWDEMDNVSPNWRRWEDTNWQNEIFSSAIWHSNNFSVRGGTRMLKYYSSFNRTKQDGTVIGNSAESISGRINLSFTPFSWLEVTGGLNPSSTDISRVLTAGYLGAPMKASLFMPTEPLYMPNSKEYNFVEGYDPFGLGTLNKANLNEMHFYSSAHLNIGSALTFDALMNGVKSKIENNTHRDYLSYRLTTEKRMVVFQDYSGTYRTNNNGLWRFEGKAGIWNRLYKIDNKFYNVGFYKTQDEYRFYGAYLNSKLSFGDRLIIDYVLRNDYSSVLNITCSGERERKSIISHYASAQYLLLSDETAENKIQTNNYLAFRTSYGQAKSGMPGYPINDFFCQSGIDFETFKNLDIGLKYALLNNSVHGELTYFRKIVSNLLISSVLPGNAAHGINRNNDSRLRNHGVEFAVNSRNVERALSWFSSFNITFISDKIEEIPENQYRLNGVLFKGEAVDAFYLRTYKGIDPSSGLPLFLTKSGGVGFWEGDTKHSITGNPQPKFYGGLANWFAYGNFDMNIFLQFVYGNHIYDSGLQSLTNSGSFYNKTEEFYHNVWLRSGDNAKYPGEGINMPNSTLHLYNASYMRLKDLTLGYNLPKPLVNKYRISSARLFARGANLLTISQYKGWNPDLYQIADFNAPYSRVFSFGVQVGF